jgi:hypothetical protein
MAQPYIISVILNTNRRDDTLECLASLAESTYQNHKVIVLDNHSADGSVAAIQAAFPAVEIIELNQNLGYAGNNNVGIEVALEQGADWVFVLNEDTVLAKDCLAQLVDVGESDPRNGIVGPMVYHHDEPDVIQSAGGELSRYWQGRHIAQNEPDLAQFSGSRQVDWVSGCGIMVWRSVIEQVGMLDERFFYYWEETEWCVRARKAGWRIIHVPQAKLWHKGVQRDYHPKPSVTYYNTRNRFLMMHKHGAPVSAWIHAWLQTLRTLTSWTLKPKWRVKAEHRNAMWLGLTDYLRHRWGQMPAREQA